MDAKVIVASILATSVALPALSQTKEYLAGERIIIDTRTVTDIVDPCTEPDRDCGAPGGRVVDK